MGRGWKIAGTVSGIVLAGLAVVIFSRRAPVPLGGVVEPDPGQPAAAKTAPRGPEVPQPIESASAKRPTAGPMDVPEGRPPLSTRTETMVLRRHPSNSSSPPCSGSEGAWHFSAGQVMTLQPGGRATWLEPASPHAADVRWLCYSSGRIVVQLPTGLMQLTPNDSGTELRGTGPSNMPLDARR